MSVISSQGEAGLRLGFCCREGRVLVRGAMLTPDGRGAPVQGFIMSQQNRPFVQ